ncbi:universal stress protein family protein [Hoeflea marina]|uniref:Universal stress protein family protein n=1 Tax=Hoeflea marina TaxID=274592 RepID=A0A317PFN2_9HYPH|nr:universal stress protein [Hoeflea marina]PWV98766.1 universal stress protein family protein [Hoeflea marina]
MFSNIMVPVDRAHADKLSLAPDTAAKLAKLYRAPVTYVGVKAATPGPVARNPAEYDRKLAAFVAARSEADGIEVHGKPFVSHAPAADLDDALIRTVNETGSDLGVMATHDPKIADVLWPSNGGKVASHTNASVFLIRG